MLTYSELLPFVADAELGAASCENHPLLVSNIATNSDK